MKNIMNSNNLIMLIRDQEMIMMRIHTWTIIQELIHIAIIGFMQEKIINLNINMMNKR